MSKAERQRDLSRCRRVSIPENHLIFLFARGFRRNEWLTIPEPVGLPETALVLGTYPDSSRRAFTFVVQDPSFEPVPEGLEIPFIEVNWIPVRIRIAEQPPVASKQAGTDGACPDCGNPLGTCDNCG